MYTAAAFLLAALVILNYLNIATPAEADKNDWNTISPKKSVLNRNDSILEIFNNCKCIAYYKCLETNKYRIAARAG